MAGSVRGAAVPLLVAGSWLASASASAAPVLSPIWTDHTVVQRDAPITIEGSASPGEAIAATLGDQSQRATADGKGLFSLTFAPRAATTTPLALRVTGNAGSSIEVHDIAIGDVWLCSGQSNMEFPVDRALNGPMEAQQSADSGLRLLQIPKATAGIPSNAFATPVAWAVAAPQTVSPFSAACYFMGRDLRKSQGVPIGLIHSSWGGSRIRPWLTPEAGEALYGKAEMAMLRLHDSDALAAARAFAPAWENWYRGQTGGSEPWRNPGALAWLAAPSTGFWNDWAGTPLATKATGTVWMRQTVTLTAAQARSGAVLKLGIVDDMDMTWVNGQPVGNSFGWDYEREYRVPASALRAGANEVIVAISNSWDKGGFASSPDKLALVIGSGDRIPLAQGWRYSIAPAQGYPPRPPWDSNGGIGVMHNRMIAPLGHIALKGAAWYQGESDVDVPGYQDRLRALFAGWRRQFSPSMRMLVVQLANFGPPQIAPAASGWATVREDQRTVVSGDANAALVTAIDIGEQSDIHPANKLTLGHRLAMAATGTALPAPVSATREPEGVRIRFSGVEKSLVAWSSDAPIGFELCGADQSSCRYAKARIDGESVVLADDGQPAPRVRYAWGESPRVNLYDTRLLPVPGFELPVIAKP